MALRILHTADWHIGKRLYGQDLQEDHRLFFEDLTATIRQEKVTHLIIAGDVFDLANPSNESLALYYEFLGKIIPEKCKVIITGGNHDSPGVLDAPGNLLSKLDVLVIGAISDDPLKEIIELKNSRNETEAVLAAVPFLRDRDIRRSIAGENYRDRIEAIREGIKKHYHTLAKICADRYPGIPALAMGHLFAMGADTSESEREIQIGNQAGIDESVFPDHFTYVALGHIHKPQNVGKGNRIRYSGSPIHLSFSERNYKKRMILLEINGNKTEQRELPVKAKREMLLFEGNCEQIAQSIAQYKNPHERPAYAELRITETTFDPELIRRKETLVEQAENSGQLKILNSRITFTHTEKIQRENTLEGKDPDELKPIDVLRTLLSGYSSEDCKEMEEAFLELINSINENGGEL